MTFAKSLFWTGWDDGFKTAVMRMKAGETIAELEQDNGIKTDFEGAFDREYLNAEREECAKIADAVAAECADYGEGHPAIDVARGVAKAIRARMADRTG